MWTIEVDYTTGSSFHSEEIYAEQIGPCWEKKEDAVAALKEIAEHTEFLDLTENRHYYGPLTKKEREARIKELKKRDWYDEQYHSVVLMLRHDTGERKYQSAFWAGHFETLHEARVVAVNNEEDECVFRPH
jgi:hypothetical protein